MKVTFKEMKVGSGTDVLISGLSGELARLGVDSSIEFYPPVYQYLPALVRLRRKGRDDGIVHSNTVYGYAFKGPGPLVVTQHGVLHDPSLARYSTTAQKAYYRYLFLREKRSLDAASAVVCVSEYTKGMLEKAFGYMGSRTIHNGVDTDVFKPMPVSRDGDGKTTTLLFVGNPSKRKGADLLPRIMKRLGPRFRLLIASGLRKDLKFESANIRSLGRVSKGELVRLYNLCDVFLFPSRLEGLSLTLLEAMACGKPIVTTDRSSMPELVVDGKGGFLCNADDVGGFAHKVEALARDENLRRSMGEYNRKRALEKFTLGRMARDYAKLYRSVAGEG